MMLNVTTPKKKMEAKLNKFLYRGFLNMDQLEAAVIAQNPGLNELYQGFVRQDLQRLESFIGQSVTTRSILSSMTEVPDLQDYAYMSKTGWKVEKPKEHDVVPQLAGTYEEEEPVLVKSTKSIQSETAY